MGLSSVAGELADLIGKPVIASRGSGCDERAEISGCWSACRVAVSRETRYVARALTAVGNRSIHAGVESAGTADLDDGAVKSGRSAMGADPDDLCLIMTVPCLGSAAGLPRPCGPEGSRAGHAPPQDLASPRPPGCAGSPAEMGCLCYGRVFSACREASWDPAPVLRVICSFWKGAWNCHREKAVGGLTAVVSAG
jgi:hypothetical protein